MASIYATGSAPIQLRREKYHELRPGHFLLLQFRPSIHRYILLPFRKDQKQPLEGCLLRICFTTAAIYQYGLQLLFAYPNQQRFQMFEHNKFETLAIPFNLARTHARTHTPYPAIQYKGKSSMQKVKMRSFVFLLFLGNLLRFRGQKEKDDNEMKLKRTRLERILCTCAGPFPPFFRLCDSDCSGVQMR